VKRKAATKFALPAGNGAVISDCGLYRYQLARRVSDHPSVLNFIMLNPSTADATVNDPTISRCIGFCIALGYGQLVVTNLYALRATDPRALRKAEAPIGPDNDHWLLQTARRSWCRIAAWGNHGRRNNRGGDVLQMFAEHGLTMHKLSTLTSSRQPRHPLYLRASLRPTLLSE